MEDAQFSLFDSEPTALERAFWEFHQANPVVYRLFDRFACQLLDRGHKNFSSDAILHRIRWETAVTTTDIIFKINDHHSAYYGRLWMRNNPQHEGFFRTRRTQGVTEALAGEMD